MALSLVVYEIFNVEKCRDLVNGVRGYSRSLKVVPFDRLCMVSYYIVFFSNFVPKTHVFDIRLVNIPCTVALKPGLGVTQGHRK